jgi:hypothetical protein
VYHVVFEVRLDGKPHPKSYGRLPTVKAFKNQDIANSWALRVEWNTPSGENKSRYIQWGQGVDVGQGVGRGHHNAYFRSISVLHFLVGVEVPSADLRSYMDNLGKANMLQAHYDYFTHIIEFGPQVPYPLEINSKLNAKRGVAILVKSRIKGAV